MTIYPLDLDFRSLDLRLFIKMDDRHQLTRANLARIQVENGLSDEKRAVDIKEDDKNDDQADFANYLTNMLPPSMEDKALETAETHEH
jgi:hypothetical protein